MSWRQGPQDFSQLNLLGNLTARLIRLTAFEKIKRGEAQLCAYGLPPGLVSKYSEYATSERYVLIPQKKADLENHVQVVESDGNEF